MSSRSPERPGASRSPGEPQPIQGTGTSDHHDLVGQQIEATIGEPWDFSSAAGDNRLTGQISAVSPDGEPVEWLICEVSPFTAGTTTISTVAAVRRYADEEPIQQLRQRGEAHVHLLYDPSGERLAAPRVSTALHTGHGDLKHLIGTIHLSR